MLILIIIGVLGLAASYTAPILGWSISERMRAAIAVAASVTILVGWRFGDHHTIYVLPLWGWYAAFVLTLAASLCLSIYIFRGSLRDRLVSPLDLAILLWAAGHLFVNGTIPGLVLFGGLAAAPAIHLSHTVRKRPAALARREGHDVISLIFGAAFFGLLSQLHIVYAGVPAFVLPAVGSSP